MRIIDLVICHGHGQIFNETFSIRYTLSILGLEVVVVVADVAVVFAAVAAASAAVVVSTVSVVVVVIGCRCRCRCHSSHDPNFMVNVKIESEIFVGHGST